MAALISNAAVVTSLNGITITGLLESRNDTTHKPLHVQTNVYFHQAFKKKKGCVKIAFLIRIKEGVGQPGLECEAFAMSAADAICAESGEELILALSVVRFNTDFSVVAAPNQAWDLTPTAAPKSVALS